MQRTALDHAGRCRMGLVACVATIYGVLTSGQARCGVQPEPSGEGEGREAEGDEELS